MILAIRALRATIFAFNASIWVSRPADSDTTEAEAVRALPFSAAVDGPVPVVPVTVHVPPVAGALTFATATPPNDETVVAVALYAKLPVIPRFDESAAVKILA